MGKTLDKDRPTNIYTLECPFTGEIRYIGKTVKPLSGRLQQHTSDTVKVKTHNGNWIKSILNKGGIPTIKLLETVPWEESQSAEMYWIAQFKTWGFRLTNETDGGEGNSGRSHSLEQRRKVIESYRARGKKVYQYTIVGDYVKAYAVGFDAAKELNLSSNNIRQCCTGGKKSHGGFIWSYTSPESFDLSKYAHISMKGVKASPSRRAANYLVAKQTKICVEDIETGQIIVTDSMTEACKLTKVTMASICRECKEVSINKQGKYKFKYYGR